MDRFVINERVYIAPDAEEAEPWLRGQSAVVLQDDGGKTIRLVPTSHFSQMVAVPRSAVRRERRGTWQRPVAYTEVPLPGDDPLASPPRSAP